MVATLWDVGVYVGKGGLLVVASFTAFLVGALLEVDPLQLWRHGGRPQWINRFRDLFRVPALARVQVFPMSQAAQRDLLEYCREEYTELGDDFAIPAALMREERQLATRLQAANVDLFDRYERLLAESSFRVNVTPPLLVLLLVLLWDSGMPAPVQVAVIGIVVLCSVMFLLTATYARPPA